ncbi:hypothetical protein CI678_26570, partial [Klebsiella pneumoniae subsp. pneumoniae]
LPRLFDNFIPFCLNSIYGVMLSAEAIGICQLGTGDNLIQHGAGINCIPDIRARNSVICGSW